MTTTHSFTKEYSSYKISYKGIDYFILGRFTFNVSVYSEKQTYDNPGFIEIEDVEIEDYELSIYNSDGYEIGESEFFRIENYILSTLSESIELDDLPE